jgi:hypothetical protein
VQWMTRRAMPARPLLRHPADLAFVAQVDHGCRAAVVDSGLPCEGTRVGMREMTAADSDLLAGAVRAAAWDKTITISRLEELGYVEESSDLPRAASTVVRLELDAFCTSAGRLAWAKANGCQWDAWTCARIAQAGSREALQWAREHGCPWEKNTCEQAASSGHVEVLRWARENDCPWDKDTCGVAAQYGQLEALRWAREHGCPWDGDTCEVRRRERTIGGAAVGVEARVPV